MSAAVHPSGVGLWAIWPRGTKRPAEPITAAGHTARDAWLAAWPRLNGLSFCECTFRLVADDASKHEPVKPARRTLRKEVRA